MTQELYEQVLAGLRSTPERHMIIDGRTYYSVAQLEEAREKAGLTKADDIAARVIRKPKAPVQTSALPPFVEGAAKPPAAEVKAPAAAPAKPQAAPAKEAPKAPAAKAPAKEPAKAPDAPAPATEAKAPEATEQKAAEGGPSEIPDNLGTLSYNELRSLAVKVGITPAPNTQADLVAALTAKRDGG